MYFCWMNCDKMIIAKGSYIQCLQAISKNGIENETSWHNRGTTSFKVRYECSQKNCNCKAEIHVLENEENGELFYQAVIIGNHQNHDKKIPKPIKEHLVMAVAKATSSGAKNIKEAIASDVGIQIDNRKIYRIKKVNLIDNNWISSWKKLPSFVETINKIKKLAFYDENNFLFFLHSLIFKILLIQRLF